MYTHNLHVSMFPTTDNSEHEQETAQAGKPNLLRKLQAGVGHGLRWAIQQLCAPASALTGSQTLDDEMLLYTASCHPEFCSAMELYYYYAYLPAEPTTAADAPLIQGQERSDDQPGVAGLTTLIHRTQLLECTDLDGC